MVILTNKALNQVYADKDSAHKDFTITPNVNYKCPGSVAAIAIPQQCSVALWIEIAMILKWR